MASQGTRFSNAFANTHGTPPSHATILTSLYQETHQVGCPVGRETPRNDSLPSDITLVHELLRDSGYLTLGVTDDGYMSNIFGFDRGFDMFWDQGAGIESGANQLIRFLTESWDGTQPVFALLHTYEIHSPYAPPDGYREAFGPIPTQVESSNEFLLPIQDNAADHLSPRDFASLRQLYDGGIKYTDSELSRLFDQLGELGFLKNCLVIITSDHGEEFGDHGGLLHRATLYEELLRVPLILFGHGVLEGVTIPTFVGLVDLAPTILVSAGLPIPPLMAGHNILKRDERQAEEDVVFAQYSDLKYSVRLGAWKLIESPRSGSVELYDLTVDPHERVDLSSSQPERVRALRQQINEWRSSLPSLEGVVRESPTLSEDHRERLEALGYVQ